MGQFRGGHREHTATEIGQVTNFCGYLGQVCWNLGLKPVTHHFLHLFAKQKMKTSRTRMNYDKHIHILTPQHMGWDLDGLMIMMHVNNWCRPSAKALDATISCPPGVPWGPFDIHRCPASQSLAPPGERSRSLCQSISIKWNIMSQPAFGQVP